MICLVIYHVLTINELVWVYFSTIENIKITPTTYKMCVRISKLINQYQINTLSSVSGMILSMNNRVVHFLVESIGLQIPYEGVNFYHLSGNRFACNIELFYIIN
jgi:hypothetical protein